MYFTRSGNAIDQQKFTELKAKYNIPQDNVKDSDSNFLYFILSKADLDIDLLNDIDWDWLKNNKSNQALKLLEQRKEQQFKGLLKQFNSIYNKYSFLFLEIPTEVLAVKHHANYLQSGKESLNSKIFSILNKLDSLGNLNKSDIAYLQQNKLNEAKFIKLVEFIKLKIKYNVRSQDSVSPYDKLYIILSKVDNEIQLTDEENQFIKNHNLTTVLENYDLQQRKREEEFVNLKEKYQATQYLETSPNSPLYKILQNIEAGTPLRDDEIKWLNDNNLNDTVALADFLTLKVKYQATTNEDLSVSSHLYKVLKKIDTDILLQDPDINFLKKRELTETITLAVDRYAKYLINQIKLRQ
ncbi:MAG TPA: hypothetical protein V6D15_01355 [Oculatellaceae cyanobacterium]